MPTSRRRNTNASRPRVRRGRERRLSIRSELRAEPDLRKIARAVVALAMAQAEKDAEAQRARAGELDGPFEPTPAKAEEASDAS